MHDWHASANGANIKCEGCHKVGVTRNSESAKKCVECHPEFKFDKSEFSFTKNYFALSYTDALHKLCVSCHIIKSRELKDKPNLAQCTTCHKSEMPERITVNLKWETSLPHFNNVILPDVDTND